jgi:hypothetical protein
MANDKITINDVVGAVSIVIRVLFYGSILGAIVLLDSLAIDPAKKAIRRLRGKAAE